VGDEQAGVKPGHTTSVQTSFGHYVQERLPVTDFPAIGEVGTKQRLHDRILNSFLVGQMRR
jgi:hypothetical protein